MLLYPLTMNPLTPSRTHTSHSPQALLLASSLLHSKTFKTHLHNFHNKRNQSCTVICELKPSQNNKNNKPISRKIILSEGAPSLSSENNVDEDKEIPSNSRSLGEFSMIGFVKKVPRKVLSLLSNLPLAIGEMFTIASLMALGTVIDQGETPSYYFDKYPDSNPVYGLFSWRVILFLGFDHMFLSPVFLGMLVLLAASLMACTYTTQIPIVKVARRWNFMQSADAIRKQDFADSLPQASLTDLGVILMGAGYEVFRKGSSLYAFKGLAGRFAPIGVHLAMLLIMAGGTYSYVRSFKGSVNIPQGLNFVMGDVLNPSHSFTLIFHYTI